MPLPIFSTLINAFRLPRAQWSLYLALITPMLLVRMVLEVFTLRTEDSIQQGSLVPLVAALIILYFSLPMLVNITKLHLWGDSRLTVGALFRFGGTEWRLLLYILLMVGGLLALTLGPSAMVLIIGKAVVGGQDGDWFGNGDRMWQTLGNAFMALTFIALAASTVGTLYLSGRLALTLCSVVTGQDSPLRATWHLSEGNGWRLIWLYILLVLAWSILTMVGTIAFLPLAFVEIVRVPAFAMLNAVLGVGFQVAVIRLQAIAFQHLSATPAPVTTGTETGMDRPDGI